MSNEKRKELKKTSRRERKGAEKKTTGRELLLNRKTGYA
jgi:hypothetical protein